MDARVLELLLEIRRGEVDKRESKTEDRKAVHLRSHDPSRPPEG